MKENKSPALLIVIMMILGITGGVIRYFHLKTGFDELGLNIKNNMFSALLIVLVSAVLIILAIIAFFSKKEGPLSSDKLRLGTIGWKSITSITLASVLIIAGTVIKFAVSITPLSVWGILNGIFMFGAGTVSVSAVRMLSAKQNGRDVNGTAALIPVFMACFSLIEYYRDISKNPVPSIYLYNVLSYISLILMLFSCAGYIFSRVSLSRVFITLLAYMFFGTMSLVGQLAYLLTDVIKTGPVLSEFLDNSVAEILILGYGFFFAISVFVLFFRPKRVAVLEE
jgi:hypothetical protein